LKKIFSSLINLGVEGGLTALDRRRIKTVNVINLIVGFFLIAGLSNIALIGVHYPFGFNFAFFCLTLLSLLLNKFNLHACAFVVFTLNTNLSIFFINQYYPYDTGAFVYYFPLIISVVLLNNPINIDRFAIIHFAICIAFFILNFVVSLPFKVPVSFDAEQSHIIWIYNMVISAVVTALLSVLVTRLIHNQSKEIVVQNINLIRAKEEVDTSLKEKEVLLAELHHRVKNNLAIIAGLLNLQEDTSPSEEVKQALSDSKARIMSMALVHKMLYKNPELKNIDFGHYVAELVSELFNSYSLLNRIKLVFECADLRLPVNKSIPLGLILNEAVTNSIKYVFRQNSPQNPEFRIEIKILSGQVYMSIKDNGPGFPEGFNNGEGRHSLGIYLIVSLTEQIDGQVRFLNEGGAKIELTFSQY